MRPAAEAIVRDVPAVAGKPSWLPEGKTAAVCFSVDDVHPATSADPYEAGGDLGAGGLGRLCRLLERHPRLRATLFVTPDWRPLWLHPTRTFLARVPFLGRRSYLARVRSKGSLRLDRFPEFARYLNDLPRTEVAVHGLHHLHRGRRLTVEFQEQDRAECTAMLLESLAIFESAGVAHVRGFQPPGWSLTGPLAGALGDLGFSYVTAARDLTTSIEKRATTSACALSPFPLMEPGFTGSGHLVHFTHNFQATSRPERAFQIVERGGIVAVKAHIFKRGGGHVMLDGLDDAYVDYLDHLFVELERRFGESLWWTSFGQIASRVLSDTPVLSPSS